MLSVHPAIDLINVFVKELFAFVCNAKRFPIVFLFFLIFLFLIRAIERIAKSFLGNVLILVTKEACDQYLNHSLDTLNAVKGRIKKIAQMPFPLCAHF